VLVDRLEVLENFYEVAHDIGKDSDPKEQVEADDKALEVATRMIVTKSDSREWRKREVHANQNVSALFIFVETEVIDKVVLLEVRIVWVYVQLINHVIGWYLAENEPEDTKEEADIEDEHYQL